MVITTWPRRCLFVWGNPAKARELPWHGRVEPGIKERVTVACDSVIRAKDSGYRDMDVATFIVTVQDIAAV